MISIDGNAFYDSDALLNRLTEGVRAANREVVFVVGAPFTAPTDPEGPGVADVRGVTELIRQQFASDARQLAILDGELVNAENPYQAAFLFLQGRRGQDSANKIIRRAVWSAYKGKNLDEDYTALDQMSDDRFAQLDDDPGVWNLSPGVRALGELVAQEPTLFGNSILTSNFDPLIEVSIKKAGGMSWRTALHSDGDLTQSKASGCRVIHIHGYWHGSDTLHTGTQLTQKRPTLKSSLLNMLHNKTVVVMGYGGWQDVFTESLETVVGNPSDFPEIIWTFFDDAPTMGHHLKSVLRAGLDRSRVTFYAGIDCHQFLPKLVDEWVRTRSKDVANTQRMTKQTTTNQTIAGPIFRLPIKKLDCDRPPNIDAWVGREPELRSLETSDATVVAICGIGGQGKSTLAAKYLRSIPFNERVYGYWDWRDCKEQGDRIRTQLMAVIERISNEEISRNSMIGASDADLSEIFIKLCDEKPGIFVFDNVDHYVDLEHGVFVGLLDTLVRAFSASNTASRLIITCRPQIKYDSASIITLPMGGLDLDEAMELFLQRTGSSETLAEDIKTVHELTNGHAFWLDLLAVQTAKVPGVTLRKLIDDLRRGRGDAPDVLTSIWGTLHDRERIVLRIMAEVVRSETEEMLEKLVSSDLNYKNFKRALKSLISLNLVVVKPETNAPDLYDLHPLVRQFVKKNFERPDRVPIIDIIIHQYITIITGLKAILGVHLPFQMLERWTQKAELEIEAARHNDAFKTLHQAADALIGGGHVEEYVRVARKLFQSIDWATSSAAIDEFDIVLETLIGCLDQLEEFADADDLLRRYEQTVPLKTARYIRFCSTKCHSYWTRGRFDEAVEWGKKGDDLKKNSDVDTQFDTSYNLALARRDGGDPAGALEYFLGSSNLAELLSSEPSKPSSSALLGNVGRCLQLLGEHSNALECFRRSAQMLENDTTSHRMSNQAYARQWIGEVLVIMEDFKLALAFYINAEAILSKTAPGRARIINVARQKIQEEHAIDEISSTIAERHVGNWINSRPK